MNIYLPVEVKARELEGKLLLAFVAAERGHSVILGEKKDTLTLAKEGHLPPGIVHDKSLTPGQYKIENFERLKHFGHLITAQDEEHGLLDKSYDEFAKRRYSEETIEKADKVFTWGNHDLTSLEAIYPQFAGKFVPTGSPRVDFWREDFYPYYKQRDIRIKPYLLIASNFGSLLDENHFWDRIARLKEAGYFDRDPEMERYMYENTAYQLTLVHEFVRMIRRLSADFPAVRILLRPHPVESVEAWKKIVGDYPNVIIERKGTISGWLRHSVAVLHNGCTTALEAAAGNIPRIAYRPLPSPLEREIPNSVSIQAHNYEELHARVTQLLNSDKQSEQADAVQNNRELLKNRFSSLEGALAADKIVNEWEGIGVEIQSSQATVAGLMQCRVAEKKSIFRVTKRKLAKIRNRVLSRSRSQKKSGLLTTSHKFPYLHEDEIAEFSGNIKHTLGRFQNVTYQRFGEKSFLIFKQ